jgi:DMSO/TMAO reductase YedYZ molybdopterin-dependent catalytic subunit
MIPSRLLGFVGGALLLARILVGQELPLDSLRIQIDGRDTVLGSSDLAGLPRASVAIPGHEGTDRHFTGIPLRAVLERAGLDTAEVHGADLARALLIEARDGYRVAFGLADLDSAITGRALLLAYAEDGNELGERQGPWQLIVPGDLHARRSVRQVTAIRILPAPKP